jgi:coenzyme F420-dependent glucose-6-phosphate dehydrogenase
MASSEKVELGYALSSEEHAPLDLVAHARRAEETGFTFALVSDHFHPWIDAQGQSPFVWSVLGGIATQTERLRIGTGVTCPMIRMHPAIVAQAAATSAAMLPGRFFLGVGTGEALNEIAVSGMEWPEFKERFARLREAVQLIRDLWTKDGVSSEGPYYKTVDAFIYDRPETPLKVYVAAGGPLVAKYAGRAGDGFIATSGKGMELYTDKLIPAVKEGAEKAGKTFEDLDRMLEVKVSYDRDPAAALENTRFWAPLSLTPEQKHSVTSATEMERLADELPIEQVAKRWIVASDPEEVVKQFQPYVDAGFNHFVVHGPGNDQERFLTQFTSDVLPLLRKLG